MKCLEVLSEIVKEVRLKKSTGKPVKDTLSVNIKCSDVGKLLEVCLKHFLFRKPFRVKETFWSLGNLLEFRKLFGGL